MRMNVGIAIGLVALVVGVVSGLAAGAFVMHYYKVPEPEVRIIERDDDGRASQRKSPQKVLTSALQQGVLDEGAPRAKDKVVEDEAEADRPRHLSPPERRELWRANFQRKLDEIRDEPRDTQWAGRTERAFEGDFADKSEKFQARLVNMDCRTTRCLARVEWDSYTIAKKNFQHIAHASYQTNCAISLSLGPKPEDPSRPHQANVVYECEEARIEEVAGQAE